MTKGNSSLDSSNEETTEGQDLIKPPREFVKVSVSLERLTEAKIKELTEVFKIRRKAVAVVKKKSKVVPSRPEIKLDSLKAGEIETLIRDLYQVPVAPTSATSSAEGIPIRRSTRKVKERVTRNYGELDSEDLEIIQAGIVTDDTDYVYTVKPEDEDDDTDLEDQELTIKEGGSRNLSKSKVRVQNLQKEDGSLDRNKIKVKRVRSRRLKPIKEKHNFFCRICRAEFHRRYEYKDHMESKHLKDGSYTCPFCQQGFFPLHPFNQHIVRNHAVSNGWVLSNERCKCKICGKEFKSPASLKIHSKSHERASAPNPNRPHVCPICHHRFVLKEHLQRHFLTHLENNPFKCKVLGCERKFTTSRNLQRHVQLHLLHIEDRRTYNCKYCPNETNQFTTKPTLDRHVALFHAKDSKKRLHIQGKKRRLKVQSLQQLETPFPSITSTNDEDPPGTSNETTANRFELESVHLVDRIIANEDMDIHIKGETLRPLSPLYNSKDKNDDLLQGNNEEEQAVDLDLIIRSDPVVKRLQKHKPDIVKSLTPFSFKNNRNFKTRDFQCQICSWSGVKAYSFQEHMKNFHTECKAVTQKTNSAEAPKNYPLDINLICITCGYQSKSPKDLSAHKEKVHFGVKKFKCSFCGYRFSKKSRLDLHEQTVHLTTDNRKHHCSHCDAKYLRKDKLNQHIQQKHDLEYKKMMQKCFKCNKCGKVLLSKETYLAHLELHSDNRKLSICNVCGQTCATIYSLRRHIQLVHMGVPNPYSKKNRKKKVQESSSKTSPSTILEGVGDECDESDDDE